MTGAFPVAVVCFLPPMVTSHLMFPAFIGSGVFSLWNCVFWGCNSVFFFFYNMVDYSAWCGRHRLWWELWIEDKEKRAMLYVVFHQLYHSVYDEHEFHFFPLGLFYVLAVFSLNPANENAPNLHFIFLTFWKVQFRFSWQLDGNNNGVTNWGQHATRWQFRRTIKPVTYWKRRKRQELERELHFMPSFSCL